MDRESLMQSVLPDEIVIVDGGSTDGTWEYLEKSRANRLKFLNIQGIFLLAVILPLAKRRAI